MLAPLDARRVRRRGAGRAHAHAPGSGRGEVPDIRAVLTGAGRTHPGQEHELSGKLSPCATTACPPIHGRKAPYGGKGHDLPAGPHAAVAWLPVYQTGSLVTTTM